MARLAGIDVFLHWTFLLLIGWIMMSYLVAGHGIASALAGVAFVLTLFACVVFHELGHALAARRYGIPTRDITLYPIGGVARLHQIPTNPIQEFVIAIAGPLVNVVIAIGLAVMLAFSSGIGSMTVGSGSGLSGLLNGLFWANIMLVVFNLIPAFPMDGGRILRAGLASVMEYSKATRIAATVGQGMAIVFAGLGLFVLSNPLLLFVALFIYIGASSEAQMTDARLILRGVPVRDAMMTKFEMLSPDDSIETAAGELLAGVQQDFPVVDDGRVVIILRRADLAKGLSSAPMTSSIADLMLRDFPQARACDLLEVAMGRLDRVHSMPVMSEGRLVGLVDTENIGELMMIRAAVQRG
jgi:Zn-dependent protease